MRTLIVGALLAGLCGCSSPAKIEYREVLVPQPVLPELPAELATPNEAPFPQFVAPSHPDAVAAITANQSLILKQWLISLNAQIMGFRALFEKPP